MTIDAQSLFTMTPERSPSPRLSTSPNHSTLTIPSPPSTATPVNDLPNPSPNPSMSTPVMNSPNLPSSLTPVISLPHSPTPDHLIDPELLAHAQVQLSSPAARSADSVQMAPIMVHDLLFGNAALPASSDPPAQKVVPKRKRATKKPSQTSTIPTPVLPLEKENIPPDMIPDVIPDVIPPARKRARTSKPAEQVPAVRPLRANAGARYKELQASKKGSSK